MRTVLFCLTLFCTAIAEDTLGVASIDRVYDGDTFYANLYSVPDIFGKHIGIRFLWIDAPEIRGSDSCTTAAAIRARDWLTKRLENACRIELRDVKRDKYFRIDAVVWVDGVNINQELVDSGYVMPYDGKGPRPTWICK